MAAVPRRKPDPASAPSRHVCNVCGNVSEKTICDGCAERLHIEALNRKKREERGDAWSRWE